MNLSHKGCGFDAEQASAQLKREQDYAHKARLARRKIENERQQEIKDKAADEAFFWKMIYIVVHVAVALLVLSAIYKYWGTLC